MKKYFAGFFALGFVSGFIVMGLLAMHASKVFLLTTRYDYVGQQEMLAAEARRKGDLATALLHYTNVVDSVSSNVRTNDRATLLDYSSRSSCCLATS
jgi:hypothetical protein